jgi:hypothetical protein
MPLPLCIIVFAGIAECTLSRVFNTLGIEARICTSNDMAIRRVRMDSHRYLGWDFFVSCHPKTVECEIDVLVRFSLLRIIWQSGIDIIPRIISICDQTAKSRCNCVALSGIIPGFSCKIYYPYSILQIKTRSKAREWLDSSAKLPLVKQADASECLRVRRGGIHSTNTGENEMERNEPLKGDK